MTGIDEALAPMGTSTIDSMVGMAYTRGMRTLLLSNESYTLALIDDEDWDKCARYTWYVATSNTGSKSVRARVKDTNNVLLARYILNDFTSENIDHKDGNFLNNQKNNLRPATYAQNAQNRKPQKSNTTGYKGVSPRPRSRVNPTIVYAATIRVNGKNKHLGIFDTKEEAALRYNKAAIKIFGEFAYLNKIEEKPE